MYVQCTLWPSSMGTHFFQNGDSIFSEMGQMRLNKSAPVGILPLMQVQVMPRTPCAHCQHEAGSLLLQVILYFLGQEL